MTARRWLFGDQLGPHFLDHPAQPVLLVESRAAFRRRRFHRAKAHLMLSAIRHRAAELGDQAIHLRVDTYAEALSRVAEPLSVCGPTSRAAAAFVAKQPQVEVLAPRGFATSRADFERWASGRGGRRLLMEDFYRDARARLGLLMAGGRPVGGTWNLDAENREPAPRTRTLGADPPWWPVEDEIDAGVREDLDRWERDGLVRFVGRDGPRRFAVTRAEALSALDRFVTHRLAGFGPHEDAMLAADWTMSHSLLSAPLNLGLLDPVECARRADQAYRDGLVPLASAEGFVRQLIGWRDYVWHLYWHLPEDYRAMNELDAGRPLPQWFTELDPDAVQARCLSAVLRDVRDHGWVHHIPRLMVLGNYAMQQGWDPQQLTDWFHRCFVDGYDWVMVANVVGMSQYADGGLMATKPYAAGGAYLHRMSDYCGGCAYDPKRRTGPTACPFTAGYWAFLARNRSRLQGNHRLAQPLRGLDRLTDLDQLLAEHADRADDPEFGLR